MIPTRTIKSVSTRLPAGSRTIHRQGTRIAKVGLLTDSRKRAWPAFVVIAALCVFAADATPAPPDPVASSESSVAPTDTIPRPRIGLVLGGGGARGVAHVGVLRVLDELRVPVDYVSGTSMGAIIAALFALGLTPDEIEAQVLAIDWRDLFSDTPDRSARTYRRKEDDHAYFLPVEFGIKHGTIATNRGIIAGQKLSFAIPNSDIYTAGYRGFDHLAYPLRTVATDLNTGEMVVMDRGNLLQAVRASMSFPGLFPPVQWEGRQLIDGGVLRNLPVDVVREMGAEIVIAVDVGVQPEEADEADLASFVGILSQTLTIQGRQNVLEQLEDADVAIEVAMGDISFKDFERVADTLAPGEAAARAHTEALRALALPPDAYAAHLRAHRLPATGPLVIEDVEISNTSPTIDAAIRGRVTQTEGHELDLTRLKVDLARIYDLGVSELVDFTVNERDGGTVLTVQANGKPYAPHIFRLGLSYSGGQQGRSLLTARVRHTWMEMNRLGAEWRNDVQLGRIAGIRSEFYQPLAVSRRPFVAVSGTWQEAVLESYEDLVETGEYIRKDLFGVVDLGYGLWNFGELRVGVRYGHLIVNHKSGTTLPEERGPRGGYTTRLGIDILDDPVFPSRGVAGAAGLDLERPDFGGGHAYDRLEVQGRAVGTVAGNTFSLGFDGGSNLGTQLPGSEEFTTGGLFRLSGYHERQIHGQTYGVVGVRWYRRIFRRPSLFATSWYVGLGAETGGAWADADQARLDDLLLGLNVALMGKTYLGPGILYYGRARDGHDALYLLMGSVSNFLN